jgi:hypothetical protein
MSAMKFTIALILAAIVPAFALPACSQEKSDPASNPSPGDGHTHTH